MPSATGNPVTQPPSTPSGKNPLGRLAEVLAGIGIVSIVVVFFVDSPQQRGVLYYGGFAAVALAMVAAISGWIPGRGQRFTVLPRTTPGWVALGMLLLGFLLSTVPSFIHVSGQTSSQLQNNAIQLGFLMMGASAIVTLVAVFRSGERSLPVIFFSLLAGFLVPFVAVALALMAA